MTHTTHTNINIKTKTDDREAMAQQNGEIGQLRKGSREEEEEEMAVTKRRILGEWEEDGHKLCGDELDLANWLMSEEGEQTRMMVPDGKLCIVLSAVPKMTLLDNWWDGQDITIGFYEQKNYNKNYNTAV
jgi:hypothetical protein